MPLYELNDHGLTAIEASSFTAEGLRERHDLQQLLRAQIDCLEDGLMLLAEEYSNWQDSSRRIDLLCLDQNANLVVVELKRTADGGHMELQALRYAAMVASLTFDQAAEALTADRARHGAPIDKNTAGKKFLPSLTGANPMRNASPKTRASCLPRPVSGWN